MKHMEWLLCPICHNKTRIKIREDTELKKFPLYCPKCKQEILINVKLSNIYVIKEPDAEPIASRTSNLLLSALSLIIKSICRTTAKEKKPSYSRYFDTTILRNGGFEKMKPPFLLLNKTWRYQGGIAMSCFIRGSPPNSSLSKKARPPPGETTLIYMNCLIIWILLTMPMRPSGLFGRAHFVRSKNF